MYRAVAYEESLRRQWDGFALTHGTVFHTTGFREVLLESFGYRCAYHAMLDRESKICALLPLVESRNLGLRKAGVSLPFVNHLDICAIGAEAGNAAIQFARCWKHEAGLDYVELRLKDQAFDLSDWDVQLQNHTFVLPLTTDEEKILSLAGANCRNHVRKVYRNDWFSVSYETEHLEAFYRVYAIRMKQLGSPTPDRDFFERFFSKLADNAFLQTVIDQQTGRVVGGMLLLSSPGDATLYYPYGANLVEYNKRYLNSFMYWEAVRLGISQGMRFLDLGRSQAGSGTFVYKQQWGAKAQQLRYLTYSGRPGGSGPPARQKFHLFVELWKRMPQLFTDPVGKRIIKYLLP